jgi:dTDP-4-dehydrorhamnose reductase
LKVLITGKDGQVGKDLIKSVPKGIELFAFGHHELDITFKEALSERIGEICPDYIINTAAYTAVDRAENESEIAYSVNSTGAEYLAICAKEVAARLIHLSTDFVFDGSQSTPYMPDDSTNPISVYGHSKAEGENRIRLTYAANSIIIRTSWVYSVTGRNFVKTMLNLMKERDELRVVVDQIGAPTWSKNLALTIWAMVTNNTHAGIYHWSDSGVTSWYDFAVAIYEEANALNIIDKQINIIPITTSQFPTPAKRPAYSVLDISQTNKIWRVKNENWRSALRKMLLDYQKLMQLTDELIK